MILWFRAICFRCLCGSVGVQAFASTWLSHLQQLYLLCIVYTGRRRLFPCIMYKNVSGYMDMARYTTIRLPAHRPRQTATVRLAVSRGVASPRVIVTRCRCWSSTEIGADRWRRKRVLLAVSRSRVHCIVNFDVLGQQSVNLTKSVALRYLFSIAIQK